MCVARRQQLLHVSHNILLTFRLTNVFQYYVQKNALHHEGHNSHKRPLNRPIQSQSRNVHLRLLAKERRANIGIPLDIFGFGRFNDFLCFEIFSGFEVFEN